jgi:glutathione S-transferase
VEVYLRMSGLPYRTAPIDLRKAPKGKAPYIEDGGKPIADSGFIIDYLKATYGDSLDGWLSAEQQAVALAFTRLLDEHLYWVSVYTRWFNANNWPKVRAAFFGDLPAPLRQIIAPLARAGLRKQIWGHGMGRHSHDEIIELGRVDLTAIANQLGSKAYFIGEQPSSIDAAVYAYLANLLWAPFESPLLGHASSHPQLERYCQRMKARYFADSA